MGVLRCLAVVLLALPLTGRSSGIPRDPALAVLLSDLHVAGVPSAAAWGDVGYALLRDCGDRAELTAVIRDCWFPVPPATPATRQIARENDGMKLVFPFVRTRKENGK